MLRIRIRIKKGLPDPDPHEQIRIRIWIQAVKSLEMYRFITSNVEVVLHGPSWASQENTLVALSRIGEDKK